MEELVQALELRRKYNNLPIQRFIKELSEYTGENFDEKFIKQFEFSGLLNTDLLNEPRKNTIKLLSQRK